MRLPEPFDDRYTNLRLLGRGGFGVVYRAWDMEMERDVALKVLNPDLASDPDWRKRFRQEATAVSKLNHPNITIVFDRSEFQDQLYIVMEFIEGETLSRIIDQRVPLSDPERLLLIEQLCEGLHYAHQRNIVHRDVKPVNLIVHEDHDGTYLTRTLKILDFGIAKVVNTGQTSTGAQLMFTPNYVAPEQIVGGQVDRRCDIFAVGAVAYELMVLRKAFVVSSNNPFAFFEEVKRKIVDQPHQPMMEIRHDIDPQLAAIIDRALAKDPADRYQDLAEMRRNVRRVRQRLEASLAEASSETTVVLDPSLRAAVTAANDALQLGDPDAAVAQLEAALRSTPSRPVKRLLERSLEEARGRQVAKRAEQAIAAARAEFQRGERTGAIALLEQFEPGQLVAEQLAQLQRAALLIDAAERALQEGSSAARAASLYELDQFNPAELTKVAGDRLRARAIEKLEEEQARERKELARAHEAVAAARDQFRAGKIEEAIAGLDGLHQSGHVAAARQEMQKAYALVQQARAAIERGGPEDRARALWGLAEFGDQSLVESVLKDLREIDTARRLGELEAAAAAAIAKARADFISGRRHDAIEAIGNFQPTELIVATRDELRRALDIIDRVTEAVQRGSRSARESAMSELAQFTPADLVATAMQELAAIAQKRNVDEQRADEEAASRARHAVALARKSFSSGHRADAIAALEGFEDAARVAAALHRLRDADRTIDQASRAIRSGTRRARAEAFAQLATATASDPELAASAVADLRALDQQRTEAEDRDAAAAALIDAVRKQFERGERAEALFRLRQFDPPHPHVAAALAELSQRADDAVRREEEARGLIANARATFMHGRRAEAIEALDSKRAWPNVSEALIELRNADHAIARATEAVHEGDEAARAAALNDLLRFHPSDLVVSALQVLRTIAAERTAQEERLELEIRAADAVKQARATFESGQLAAAIALLEQFSPSVALVDAALADLRTKRQRIEAEIERARLVKQAAATTSQARTLLRAGDVDGALALLVAFQEQTFVADELDMLRSVAKEIEAARASVTRDVATARRAAIAKLERLSPQDLVESAINELLQIDSERTAEEARIEAAHLAAEAERISQVAREAFVSGERESALATVERFRPVAMVEETLAQFRAALDAIERAERVVSEGDDLTREHAIPRAASTALIPTRR